MENELMEAVMKAGGFDVVAEALDVSSARVQKAIAGVRPMSAAMAKKWNERYGDLYQATVPRDRRKTKKILISVDSDIWDQAKRLAKVYETTATRALCEMARIGSHGDFAAALSWLRVMKLIDKEAIPQTWRYFQSEIWGDPELRIRPIDCVEPDGMFEDWG